MKTTTTNQAVYGMVMARLTRENARRVVFHCEKNGKRFTVQEVPHLAAGIRVECEFNRITIEREELVGCD